MTQATRQEAEESRSHLADLVIAAFLDLVRRDQLKERDRSIGDYQVLFPGYEKVLEQEWTRLHRGDFDSETETLAGIRIGERIGDLLIKQFVARGGQGVVLRAIDERLGRTVAIKVIHPHARYSPVALRRFERETQIIARLDHRGICPIHSFGSHQNRPHFVMPWLAGVTLATMLRERRRSGVAPDHVWVARMLRVGIDFAGAIAYAHEQSIAHRDFKPSNVMIGDDDRVTVMDLGLARDLNEHADVTLTQPGDRFGTVGYMAPEQAYADGQPIGLEADVFALCVTMYQAVAGHLPYDGCDAAAYRRALRLGKPKRLSDIVPDLPAGLSDVIMRGLSVEREDRYPNATALLSDLEAVRDGGQIERFHLAYTTRIQRFVAHRPGMAIGLLMSVALAGTSAWAWTAAGRGIGPNAFAWVSAEVGRLVDAGDLRAARKLLNEVPVKHRRWPWRFHARRLDGGFVVVRPETAEASDPPQGVMAVSANGARSLRVVAAPGSGGQKAQAIREPGQPDWRHVFPDAFIERAAWSGDTRKLALVLRNVREPRHWRIETWDVDANVRFGRQDLGSVEVTAVAWASDDMHVMIGRRSGRAERLDLRLENVARFDGLQEPVCAFASAPGGFYAIGSDNTRRFRLHAAGSGLSSQIDNAPIRTVGMIPNGQWTIATDRCRAIWDACSDVISAWDVVSRDRETPTTQQAAHPLEMMDVECLGETVSLVDRETRTAMLTVTFPTNVTWASFEASGRWLTVGESSGRVHVLDGGALDVLASSSPPDPDDSIAETLASSGRRSILKAMARTGVVPRDRFDTSAVTRMTVSLLVFADEDSAIHPTRSAFIPFLPRAWYEFAIGQHQQGANNRFTSEHALALYRLGDLESAVILLDRYLDDHPDNTVARLTMALCLWRQGESRKASALLAATKSQDSGPGARQLRFECRRIDDPEFDRAWTWTAKQVAAGSVSGARRNLTDSEGIAHTELSTRERSLAARILHASDSAALIIGRYAERVLACGHITTELRDASMMLAQMARDLATDPSDRSLLRLSAVVRLRAGDPNEALDTLRQLEQAADPIANEPTLLAWLALAHAGTGQIERAQALHDLLRSVLDDHPWPRALIARLLATELEELLDG